MFKCAKTDLERLKFLQHLRIFSKLRNFEPLINKIMENTIAYFGLKDEDDYMYKKGEANTEARLQKKMAQQRAEAEQQLAEAEQQRRFTVIRLLDTTVLTEEQIIKICDISTDFVQTIKMDLAAAVKKIARLKKTTSIERIAHQLNLPANWVEKQVLQG